MPGQQGPEADLGVGLAAGQADAEPGDLAESLIGLGRDVRQRDLVDPQQVGEQLAVEPVGLGAALDHRAEAERVGDEDRAVGGQQVVEPPVRARRLDHGAERSEPLKDPEDAFGVLTADAGGLDGPSRVIDGGDNGRGAMQVDADVPHEQVSG